MKRFMTALLCAIILLGAMCATANGMGAEGFEKIKSILLAVAYNTIAVMMIMPKQKNKKDKKDK